VVALSSTVAAAASPRRRIALDRARVRRALQSAVACVLGALFVLALQQPESEWILFTVLTLTQRHVGSSVQKTLMRIAGTLVGAGIALLLLGAVQQPPIFLGGLLAVAVFGSYMASGRWFPYAFTTGGLTTYIVAVPGMASVTEALQFAGYRTSNILFGAILALVGTLAVWPVRAIDELVETMVARVRAGRRLTLLALERALRGVDGDAERELQRLDALLAQPVKGRLAILDNACAESRFYQAHRAQYVRFLLLGERVSLALRSLYRESGREGVGAVCRTLEAPLTALARATEEVLGDLERAIENERAMPDPAPRLDVAYAAFESAYAAAKEAGRFAAAPSEAIGAFNGLVRALRETAPPLHEQSLTLDWLADVREGRPVPRAAPAPPSLPDPRRLWPRFDRRRMLFAVRCGLATISAVLAWVCLQWPIGPKAVIISYFIVSNSYGVVNRRVAFRVAGTVAGGVLALLVTAFAAPAIEYAPGICSVVFAVAFVSAYLYLGPHQNADFGLWLGLVFFLSFDLQARQPRAVEPVLLSFVGTLLGALLGGFLLRVVWPDHPRRDLAHALARSLERSASLLHVLVEALIAGSYPRARVGELVRQNLEELSGCPTLLGEAALEPGATATRQREALGLLAASDGLLTELRGLSSVIEAGVDRSITRAAEAELRALDTAAREALEALAIAVRAERRVAALPDLEAAHTALGAAVDRLRASPGWRARPAESTMAFHASVERLREATRALVALAGVLHDRVER
jgi:uncharacterized membrane protein YccC